MRQNEAENLAWSIPREAKAKLTCKVGCTNGEFVVHVHNHDAGESQTVRHSGEWLAHDWNKLNKRRKAQAAEPDLIVSARQHLNTRAQLATESEAT